MDLESHDTPSIECYFKDVCSFEHVCVYLVLF